ncbi:MAG: amidohydrolase family protein [Gammaproteobacteria bacterium]|nr:amidohydrolase family protein [Gammaproteobacteria bacterium]
MLESRRHALSMLKGFIYLSFATLFNLSVHADVAPYADSVIINGQVITADNDAPDQITFAEAIAIRGDRIMAVGSNDEIRQLIADWTEVIDAKGNSVIPGLIDSHNHLYEHTLGFSWALVSMPEMLELRIGAKNEEGPGSVESFTEIVLGAIRARAAQIPEGSWIRMNARPPDLAVKAFGTTITRDILDEIAPNHPAYITTRGGSVVNTKTIEAFEQFYGSRMPDDYWIVSRELGTSGEYNDFDRCAKIDIINTQFGIFDKYIKAYMEAMQVNAQIGVTSFKTHLQCEGGFSATSHLDRNDMMPIRLAWGHRWWQPFSSNIHEMYRRIGDWTGYGSDYFWSIGSSVGGIDAGGVGWCSTIPADESIKNREQCPPLINDIDIPEITEENIIPNRGRRLEHLDTLAELAGENRITGIPGWHVAGDGAVDVLQKTYRKYMSDNRIRNLRIQADHCFGIRPDQIEMAARLGQSFACNFDTENTFIIEEDYGSEYLAWNAPVASMLKAGVNTVLGSFGTYGRIRNSPFEDGVNWLTRKDDDGRAWGLEEEAVPDRLTLLLMMSRFGSYPVWKEHSIGSIEAGKLADIVILNGDYMAVPVEELDTLTSIMTLVGGKVTYEEPELRGNTLRFNIDTIDWTFDMQTPTTLWRWNEAPVPPPFLNGANGY